ncbi:hypothetical protein niasHS_014736 [Heterodera schachtii]|uniref:Ig-like domain-containing protein n=1 Tax=Heterodera schachtii TaxID=97005 RepID=A0ABD2IFP9_HETSC
MLFRLFFLFFFVLSLSGQHREMPTERNVPYDSFTHRKKPPQSRHSQQIPSQLATEFVPSNGSTNALEEEQNIIQRLLHSENNAAKELYDWRVRPRGTVAALSGSQWSGDFDVPVMVDVNMYLRSISKVDDVNMEFTMHFTFRQEWTDERLFFLSPSLAYIVLVSSEHSQRIFLPDTFFQNEKDGKKHDVDKPNVFIRVYNGTGRILYSSRLTLTLSCPMHLQAYPLDTQTCFIDYASYAYTTKDLEYRWKAGDPIQMKPGMRQSLPSFVLSAVTTGNCTSVTNTGTYSCLRTVLRLRREFSYYLLQLYVPSFMLVAVSTVSFWLDKDSVPARITLGTTVLLTVTTMASGINAKLPPVSYTKSVDIWIGVCTGFIFAALLEFSLVNWAARKESSTMAKSNRRMNNPLLSAMYK